jgi:atypical dual specificity phosphatase
LWKLGITHVLNAAHGGLYCQGGPDFYGSSVSYLGVPAYDLPDFNISTYFSSAADFIHRALNTPGGRNGARVHISHPLIGGEDALFPP